MENTKYKEFLKRIDLKTLEEEKKNLDWNMFMYREEVKEKIYLIVEEQNRRWYSKNDLSIAS
jgi:hypothetical protein